MICYSVASTWICVWSVNHWHACCVTETEFVAVVVEAVVAADAQIVATVSVEIDCAPYFDFAAPAIIASAVAYAIGAMAAACDFVAMVADSV